MPSRANSVTTTTGTAGGGSGSSGEGADILIAADSAAVREEIKAVLRPTDTIREVRTGAAVLAAVRERLPDLLVSDFQVASMGGMAICLELRLEEGAGRLGRVPVLLLLDRRPDVFLARRSEADGWLVKPLDPIRLRRAIRAVLAGEVFEDDSFRPADSAALG